MWGFFFVWPLLKLLLRYAARGAIFTPSALFQEMAAHFALFSSSGPPRSPLPSPPVPYVPEARGAPPAPGRLLEGVGLLRTDNCSHRYRLRTNVPAKQSRQRPTNKGGQWRLPWLKSAPDDVQPSELVLIAPVQP